jgi:hypothetical protein
VSGSLAKSSSKEFMEYHDIPVNCLCWLVTKALSLFSIFVPQLYGRAGIFHRPLRAHHFKETYFYEPTTDIVASRYMPRLIINPSDFRNLLKS